MALYSSTLDPVNWNTFIQIQHSTILMSECNSDACAMLCVIQFEFGASRLAYYKPEPNRVWLFRWVQVFWLLFIFSFPFIVCSHCVFFSHIYQNLDFQHMNHCTSHKTQGANDFKLMYLVCFIIWSTIQCICLIVINIKSLTQLTFIQMQFHLISDQANHFIMTKIRDSHNQEVGMCNV